MVDARRILPVWRVPMHEAARSEVIEIHVEAAPLHEGTAAEESAHR